MLRFLHQINQGHYPAKAINKNLQIAARGIAKITFGFLVLLLFADCQSQNKNIPDVEYEIQRIWTGRGPDFGTGDISPDGKYFSDINWDNGNIKLVNLVSDEAVDLTRLGYDEGGYAWMSSFSSKGDLLAYEWYNYDTWTHELRVYSFKDSTDSILLPADEDVLYLEPMSWTPDDSAILIAKQFDESDWELGFVSPEDGSYDTLISLEWNAPGGLHPFAYPSAELSPDGRYIGFGYRSTSSSSTDLFLVSVEDRQLRPLLRGHGEDHFLAWRKDGKQILFYSDRSGDPALWVMDFNEGFPEGEPRLLMDNVTGLTPIGPSDQGYVFGVSEGDRNVYIAEVDFQTGQIIQKPAPVDSGKGGRNSLGAWSEDGRSLLCIRFPDLPATREKVVIHPLDGTQPTEVFFPWDFHNKTGTVSWYAPGNLLIDGNSPQYSGIHRFDLNTGQLEVPADYGEMGFFQRFKTNSNGSKIYVEMRWGEPGLVAFETESGDSERLYNGQIVPGSTVVSPDDRLVSFLRRNPSSQNVDLVVLDVETGTVHTVLEKPQGTLSLPLAWTADGTGIIAGVTLPGKEKGLWHIRYKGASDPVFIPLEEAVYKPLVVSPDGRHVAFVSGEDTGSIYLLKGF